ncbi:MAG: sulfatase-like hydrolase/transferase, partial [Clostridia bacterium]|nr:sulfatase-like hydrolase/transferase [Clostridia bacterium]
EWIEEHVSGVKYNPKSMPSHTDGIYYSTGIQHCDWTARPWPYEEHLHFTNWTVNEAIRFLEMRDPSMPFFLKVSFLAPHPPFIPPRFYMDRYLRNDLPKPLIGDWETPPPEKGIDLDAFDLNLKGEALKSMQAAYYGLINHIDDQIRRFMKIINNRLILKTSRSETKEQDDRDTIVIFTSDHGEMLGDHYRRRKGQPYQGSVRIPFMIKAGKKHGINPGKVSSKLVGLQDIMPTVLDMVGIDIPKHIDGESLVPLFSGEHDNFREYLHLEHAPRFQSIVTESDKFIWHVASGSEQYFDLVNDPGELHNAIQDEDAQGRIAYLRNILIKELKNRPEGFVSNGELIPGCEYGHIIPGY